jgi:pyruvate dehydrogenase kinase 2/3/4
LELKEHLSRHTRARLTARQRIVRHQDIYRRILPELRLLQVPLDECNRYFIYYNFLASQLMNLEGQDMRNSGGRIGTIDTEINLLELVRGAVDEAKGICNHVYGDCPDVKLVIPNSGDPTTFAHKSSTIHYILVELMKNALRATVDAHMKRNEAGVVTCDDMPAVKILVSSRSSTSHSCVCIEDEGKGIPRSEMDLVMSYTYTTAAKPAIALMEAVNPDHDATEHVDMSPLAGYGFGLPVSRMYARCFEGDLSLQSIEGFGTKAFLYIKSSSRV